MLEDKRKEYLKLLRRAIEIILSKLGGKAEKISIFGSYPRRNPDLFTDLDVLIIMRTDKPFLERMKEIYSLLALPVDADILCYTPEEISKLRDKGFFKKIAEGEVVIYEKGSY